MTARLDLVVVCKQIIPMQQLEVPQKCIFLKSGNLYGKILTFSIFKKPFNVWNQLTPENNTTFHLHDSVLRHWKPLKLTILGKKKTFLLFFSLIDGRSSSGINIVANTEFFYPLDQWASCIELIFFWFGSIKLVA